MIMETATVVAILISGLLVSFTGYAQEGQPRRKNMAPTASEIMVRFNLTPNAEGGFYRETFRDTSVNLSTSQLPPRYKVDRPISTAIYFLLPSGNISHLHRLPSAETWHFYMGEPLTIVEMDDKDGNVKSTCIGQDVGENQRLQYTVPPNVWFGAFPTRDYNIAIDNVVVKNAERDAEEHFSLVGCTVAPAFQYEDFVLAKRSDLISRFPAHESLLSLLTSSD